jgi:hypothetical protein
VFGRGAACSMASAQLGVLSHADNCRVAVGAPPPDSGAAAPFEATSSIAEAVTRIGALGLLAHDLRDRCECEPFGTEVGNDLRKNLRRLRAAAMGQDDAAVHCPPIHVGAHLLG